ncbi:MAG TPA: MBL fold metallo-hydrolase [Gammaproteobacteria bacterium]|jgi:glyoxylase-like metal-dependent hydrolase (beta-lactamase superfamily II)|nr:MBL fold metallo-hydrolase [Gammaproteobacteria bacterium]HIF88136.1 MBL fold metallo-hydrolase [Gammaproteobacteria bacterium]HIL62801.1 MBL fold metallo-hydrolase [Porticoccaceae bacterium]HIN90473.1 MBL fold metallo-hydrolase [Porticoccaceae bacterium]
MRRVHLLCVLAAFSLTASLNVALAQEIIDTPTHRLEEVAEGIYFATGNGALYTMSNALIIERDEDVVVVDSHITPAAGRALLDSIRVVTSKPVTTLINSHYHYDHANGVPAFGPDIEIIGHEVTYEKLTADPANEHTYLSSLQRFDNTVARLEQELENASSTQERQELQEQLEFWQAHVSAQEEIVFTPPTTTLRDTLTLYRGGREIQLHYFGRAHTGGDLAIYLPEEKIVFTGDMMLGGVSYMGDGYVTEWADTLQALKQLDFDLVLPGHGPGFSDRARIDNVQAYYTDLTEEVRRLKGLGYSAEEAATRADLRQHADTLGITQLGANLEAVQRMYDIMDGLIE